jgi:3-hydroxyacyl-[acyl-carrier-protein] dehydratase
LTPLYPTLVLALSDNTLPMLNDRFYKIIEKPKTNELPDAFSVKVELDPHHAVYEGHFPGNPVAPGVCLIQMIMEALEDTIQKKLFLSSSDNIKFLAIVNPLETSVLTIAFTGCRYIEKKSIQVSAIVTSGEKIFIKCKNTYQVK